MALRKGSAAGTLACFVVVGAIGWGGYSAQSTLNWLRQADAALAFSPTRHTSNTDAKGDRLAVAGYQLAAIPAGPTPPVRIALAPAGRAVAPSAEMPNNASSEPIGTTAAPRAAPPGRQAEKPKPQPPKPSGLLDDAQIASIKGRLRLTADQEGYWPAVEAALRDVVKQQLRDARRKDAPIDVNSPEVQRLTWAAMPLLMRMREDQKREIRTLARVIGLDAVASQI
jgi:hypothetical protein